MRPGSVRVIESLLGGRRSLTELAASIGVAKPSILPTLRRLVDIGWVQREEIRVPTGRETFYSLRPGSLHIELRPEAGVAVSWAAEGEVDVDFPMTMQVPDAAVREEILTALRLLRKRLKRSLDRFAIILYGSAARSEMTWKSDIDIALVYARDESDETLQAVYDTIADVQEYVTHSVKVMPIERSALLAAERGIPKEVTSEGIVIHAGREDPIWAKMARHHTISI